MYNPAEEQRKMIAFLDSLLDTGVENVYLSTDDYLIFLSAMMDKNWEEYQPINLMTSDSRNDSCIQYGHYKNKLAMWVDRNIKQENM